MRLMRRNVISDMTKKSSTTLCRVVVLNQNMCQPSKIKVAEDGVPTCRGKSIKITRGGGGSQHDTSSFPLSPNKFKCGHNMTHFY